jgi:HSP20 family protein
VKAELPGIDPKEIDISIRGDMLTIRGERKKEEEKKGENYHRVERSYGSFSRCVRLPAEVDPNKVDAKYKDGILKIEMAKTKEAATKKIEVKVG